MSALESYRELIGIWSETERTLDAQIDEAKERLEEARGKDLAIDAKVLAWAESDIKSIEDLAEVFGYNLEPVELGADANPIDPANDPYWEKLSTQWVELDRRASEYLKNEQLRKSARAEQLVMLKQQGPRLERARQWMNADKTNRLMWAGGIFMITVFMLLGQGLMMMTLVGAAVGLVTVNRGSFTFGKIGHWDGQKWHNTKTGWLKSVVLVLSAGGFLGDLLHMNLAAMNGQVTSGFAHTIGATFNVLMLAVYGVGLLVSGLAWLASNKWRKEALAYAQNWLPPEQFNSLKKAGDWDLKPTDVTVDVTNIC